MRTVDVSRLPDYVVCNNVTSSPLCVFKPRKNSSTHTVHALSRRGWRGARPNSHRSPVERKQDFERKNNDVYTALALHAAIGVGGVCKKFDKHTTTLNSARALSA
jgi:hypothetical protein